MIQERPTGPRRRGLLSLLAIVLALATACGAGPGPGIIKVGLVAPLSGSDTATGLQMLFGMRLALREWNASGGVDGQRVYLVSTDDRDDAAEGERQARAMVIDPAVIGVVGHVAAESALAAAPRYDAAGLALVTLADSVSWAAGARPSTTFTFTPPAEQWSRAVAALVVRRAKAESVVIVQEPGPSNESFTRSMTEDLRAAGVSVIRTVTVSATQSRYDQAVQNALEPRPGAIVLATNFVTAGEIAAEVRSLSAAPLVLAPRAERPEILRVGGTALEGAYTLSPVLADPPGERVQQFAASYRQLANAAPGAHASLAYDATNLLLTAARQQLRREGRVDRAGVVRELSREEPMDGLNGPIVFDQDRSRRDARLYGYRIVGSMYPGQPLGEPLSQQRRQN